MAKVIEGTDSTLNILVHPLVLLNLGSLHRVKVGKSLLLEYT